MFRYQEFDVAEMSFSSYLRTVAAGTSAYIGLPVEGPYKPDHYRY